MSLDIKTSSIRPKRHTYANIVERFGEDRTASRYEEATYDLEPTTNFHYRPTWQPQYELYDEARTAIRMTDWYTLLDPRQFYYGTYTIARHKMMEAAETQISFVEDREMLDQLTPAGRQAVAECLLPLRHFEWGANMNNMEIARFGCGTAVTQAASFCAMDRLGLAQLLCRLGMAMDAIDVPPADATAERAATANRSGLAALFKGKSTKGAETDTGAPADQTPAQSSMLQGTKAIWLDDPKWQGLRKAVEDSFVLEDWFELFVAQNLVMDALIYETAYQRLDQVLAAEGGAGVSMATEMLRKWSKDHQRWVDAVIKGAVAESDANKAQIQAWVDAWSTETMNAITPLVEAFSGAESKSELSSISQTFSNRVSKLGLSA